MNFTTFETNLFFGFAILAAVAFGVWAIVYYLAYAVRSQVLGATVWRGRENTNAVALTFDDGPSADTEKLLDVLGENNVKAAFFLIGKQAKKFPETARRIHLENHEIGNHSFSHPIFLFCSSRRTEREICEAQEAITKATGGVAPRMARPPCGVRSLAFFRTTRRLGLETVQWTVAGFDWKRRDARQIADAVLRDVKAGSIILLHDGDSEEKSDRRETVAAIPLILDGLREKNLRVVPLEQLLRETERKFVDKQLKNHTFKGESNRFESHL